MPRILVAVIDRLSNDITGTIMPFPHPAPAIRTFGDIASHPESQVGKHIHDYDLVQLGVLNDDMSITPLKEVLLTGSQWKMAQTPHLGGDGAAFSAAAGAGEGRQ